MMSYALRNFQAALETSGHNVSNVNTPGYSRQRVLFQTNDPMAYYARGWQSIGQGMQISSIGRIRDGFLDRNLTSSNGNLGKFSTAATGLKQVEGVFNEPSDSGVIAAMGQFFDAWSGLGSNPGDPGAKLQARNAGQTLADRIRIAWQDLDRTQVDAKVQIDTTITQINDLSTKIDRLNTAIKASAVSGHPASDLMDERDAAVQQMGNLVNVQTETFTDGTLAVYAAGFTLVDSAGTMPFPSSYDVSTGTVTNGTITNVVRGGKLAGLFIQSAEVTNQKSRLDGLANNLRTTINGIHMTGVNEAGTANVKFFNDVAVPPQSGAVDFDLDIPIKTDIANLMSGTSGNPGDGGLALSLAAVRDSNIAGLGAKSFDTYLHETIDVLASTTAYYVQAGDTELSVNEQIKNQIQAVSGVSLDDEMADLVKFQRSYQAAAKTITVFDQVTQDLINMLNR